MKSEKGFTLMEMVVSIGVIAIIGTLLISTIVTTNANTETADFLVYMENLTKEAREIFEVNPNGIIAGPPESEAPDMYPYNSMLRNSVGIGSNVFQYSGSVRKNLVLDKTPTPGDEKYRIIITFTSTDKTNPSGFSFTTKTYEMDASVYEVNDDGSLQKEAIYTKKHTFDDIEVHEYPTVGELKTVTFNGNGGCIVDSATSTSCKGTSVSRQYFKGDSLLGTSSDGDTIPFSYKNDGLFIGWSLGSTDRDLLQSNFQVENDITVYAQYLNLSQYRLEFRINGSERFNVDGLTGEAAIKPYFVEKNMSSNPVMVKDLSSNIDRFFVNNAVRKNGYKFLYWKDVDGNKVTQNTILSKKYTVLYPHFEPLENGDQEIVSVNLSLDLRGISAGNNTGDPKVERLFARYPFTKMEYELKYDENKDSMIVVQNEIFNGDYGSLTSLNKGTVLSRKEFDTTLSSNLKFVYNGNKYSTFREYMDDALDDSTHIYSVSDIRLHVIMPTFTINNYFQSTKAKDDLKSGGITLNGTQAQQLFDNPEQSVFEFKKNAVGESIPFTDVVSMNKFANKISNDTGGQGELFNVGSVMYENSGEVSYDSYVHTSTIPGKEVTVEDKHIREFSYTYVVPSSTLKTLNSNIVVSNASTFVRNGNIWVKFDLKFANGRWAVTSNTSTEINTGVPYVTSQNIKGPDGDDLKQYARLIDLNVYYDGRYIDSPINVKGGLETIKPNGTNWYPDEAFSGRYEKLFNNDTKNFLNNRNSVLKFGGAIGRSLAEEGDPVNCYTPYYSNGMIWGPTIMSPYCVELPNLRWVSYNEYAYSFKYTIKTDPIKTEIEILTFAKDPKQNYLPPFITSIPYKK